MEYSPKKMKEILTEDSFKLKKKYGQNFIIDENIINSIIKKSDIDNETLVIEVGPGAGSLTYKLAQCSNQVLAYEIDKSLERILKNNLKEFNNVDIVYEDFLCANVMQKLQKVNAKKVYLVANLPYYITTPIITKIIEYNLPIDKMVVMVQKEVGDRFKATAGTKEYGSLSVYLNYYFDIKKLLDVSANVFLPKPNVDSVVIEFDKKHNLQYLKNKDLFFKLTKESFTQKRKTLRNNLKNYDLKKVEEVLIKHGLDLGVRAEQLPLEIFIEIANNL